MTHRRQTDSTDLAYHLRSVGTRARSLSGLAATTLRLVGLLLVLGTSSLLLLEIGTLAHLALILQRHELH